MLPFVRANSAVEYFVEDLVLLRCSLAQIPYQRYTNLNLSGQEKSHVPKPDGSCPMCVCVHVHEKNEAKLHWLSHLAISLSPLATQWLTQRLIGVLKASYLTNQNNKRRYHAGSLSCLVSVPFKNVSYLFPSACWFKPDSICPHSPCSKLLYLGCNPACRCVEALRRLGGGSDLTLVMPCKNQTQKYKILNTKVG